jgi:8-oxo-dGTP pyrophosphatase MutT (NUDIX family)
MREIQSPRPAVTVATIVVRDGAFLLVEEETRDGVRLNQPAGHLEAGETLVDAAVRETLEETGYRVAPTALVGIYRWQSVSTGTTFIRFAFAGDVVAHEAHRRLGIGAEIAALVQEHAFYYLDAPIVRVAALDVPIPASKPLEDAVLPGPSQILQGIRDVLS